MSLLSQLRMTFAQIVFTLFMYAIGVVVLAIAIYPSALLIAAFWAQSADMIPAQRLFGLCLAITLGYFVFGFTLIATVSAARILLRLNVAEGVHAIGSPDMLKWMMASALYVAVRVSFMEFILLTPFCAFFFKMMGAKLGHNVQINSARTGDISLLEIGDNSVIGGNATVICHAFEPKGLSVRKVRIGKNVIVGLNSIIMPGCVVGNNAVIAAGAILPKNTVVKAGEIYYGKKK